MKTGVLFDLDGVLIDSESIYTEFWEDVDEVFPTNVPDFAHIIKGSTLPKILGTYFPDKNIQQQILDMISCFEKDMRYTPFIEAMRFVGELNEAGIECAIVTSSSLQKMENLYRQNPGFRDKFKAVITSDLVIFSKPHPQPYLLGAKAIGVSPENCFVFEDSLSGIESGKAAGATVIGLATTLPLDAIKGKAHKTITDFAGFHISDMLSVKQN